MYRKKIFCAPLFFIILLVLLIISSTSVRICAATIGFKKILIGETDITDRGDTTLPAGDGSILWDYKTSTLTLDNATVDSITIKASYPEKDITIYLKGTNHASGTIYANCNLTITGDSDASLNVTAARLSYGIHSAKSITLNNTTINVSSSSPSIYAEGNLTIKDSHITATSTRGSALYAGGTLSATSTDGIVPSSDSIHTSCTIDSDAYYCALSGLDGINIDGISLTAHSATYFVLYSENSDDINITSSVAAISSDDESFASYAGVAAYVNDSAQDTVASEIYGGQDRTSLVTSKTSDATGSSVRNTSDTPSGARSRTTENASSDTPSGTRSRTAENASSDTPSGARSRTTENATADMPSGTEASEQLTSPPTGDDICVYGIAIIFLTTLSLVLISSRRGHLYPHRSLRK
jgi:hypothetical protein